MNLELLESFGQNYPEQSDGTLDTGSMAVTCTFNRHGTLLAVGCNDGRIVVWDFLTRGIAKVYNAHAHPVCSLSWSRNGRQLISAATDNLVCVWDVLSGECLHTYRFSMPIMKVQFCPRNADIALICPLKTAPVLLTVGKQHSPLPTVNEGDCNVVASFNRRGKYIFTGNSKGQIAVIDVLKLKIMASFRVTTGSINVAIKQIEFARKGSSFLVNTADRVIRVYDGKEVVMCGMSGEPEPIQKLQDLVNRTAWKKCCFSGDGEFICAGSAKQHQLNIWEKSVGNLVKILQGVRGEQLLDVVWHPIRPILCSISNGVVSVWAQNQVENWSAFAPDFTELDENVEYEERESEFDEEDEDKSGEENVIKKEVDDKVEVDVTSIDPIRAFCSSDEEDQDHDCLEFLPISPEIDEPEESVLLPPVDPTSQTSIEPSAKKQKVQTIKLESNSGSEEHPLVKGSKKSKKRPMNSKSKTNKPTKDSKKSSKVKNKPNELLSMGTTIDLL